MPAAPAVLAPMSAARPEPRRGIKGRRIAWTGQTSAVAVLGFVLASFIGLVDAS